MQLGTLCKESVFQRFLLLKKNPPKLQLYNVFELRDCEEMLLGTLELARVDSDGTT